MNDSLALLKLTMFLMFLCVHGRDFVLISYLLDLLSATKLIVRKRRDLNSNSLNSIWTETTTTSSFHAHSVVNCA